MKADFFDRRATLRTDVETMLDQVQESLKIKPSLSPAIHRTVGGSMNKKQRLELAWIGKDDRPQLETAHSS